MGVVSGLRSALNRSKGATGTACEHESVEWAIDEHWRDGLFVTDSHGLVYAQYEREYKRCADCRIPPGEDGQPNTSTERRITVHKAHSLYSEPIGDELDGEELHHSLI